MDASSIFNLPEINPDELSPAVWAYIGDAVYELFIRNKMLAKGPARTKMLHQEVTARVKASFQAELVKRVENDLSEAEINILKRGRNVKSGHTPESVDVITYRHSTAFEALIGYLYLHGNITRLNELLEKIIV